VAVTQEITYLDNSAVRLTFTYKNEDLRAKYNEIVNGLAKELQIKGFRKGKAPISVLEKKLGKTLKQEALNTIIGKTVDDAIKSEDFPDKALPLAYSIPEVEGEPVLDLSGDLVFSVKHDIMPVFTVATWQGFEVEVDTAEVTEADIDRRLQEIREQNAIVIDKDDDASAEKDDIVTVDYCELTEDGTEIPGAKREDFTFTLGSGYNIFRFDDEITGMKKDETRDIVKTYPDDFEDGDLAGQTKKIRVTLTALKQQSFPDDDELAQDYDENFNTIGDLRANIASSLEKSLESSLMNLKVEKIMEKIIEENPLSLPESMIHREFAVQIQRLLGDRVPKETLDRLTPELIDAKSREQTEKKLKTFLITNKLITDLNIEALPEDIDLFYANMAESMEKPFDEVKKNYINSMGGEYYLIEEIKQKKFASLLLEKNTIKIGKKVNLLDIIPKNS
jgi:trigger factor